MTQLALDIRSTGIQEVVRPIALVRREVGLVAPSRTIVKLGAILILLQILDGVLTGIGINSFGTSAEGNVFLRALMEQWGTIPALIIVKSFAIMVVCALCMLSGAVNWIKHAMRAIICVYLLAAVIPWVMILTNGSL